MVLVCTFKCVNFSESLGFWTLSTVRNFKLLKKTNVSETRSVYVVTGQPMIEIASF
jgi:hypothetical protein